MNKDIAKQWCAALRSGEYKQGQNALRDVTNDTYCCLGVLCEVFIKGGGNLSQGLHHEDKHLRAYNGRTGLLPLVVQRWAEMETSNGKYNNDKDSLVFRNDAGLSFDKIATVIEEQVDNL
jgi:hypothetical protein